MRLLLIFDLKVFKLELEFEFIFDFGRLIERW